jgi:hypothetical protein
VIEWAGGPVEMSDIQTSDAIADLRQLAIEVGAEFVETKDRSLVFEVKNRHDLSNEKLREIANTLGNLLATSPDEGIQKLFRQNPSLVLR